MKILANEFVLPIGQNTECHASHFVLTNDGRIFCVFFFGSKEGRDDIRIYGAFRNEGGGWGEPFPISEDDGIAHWNPVLFRKKDGSFLLFYKIGKIIPEWKTYYRVSYDNCRTWSDSRELVPGDECGGRGPVRNKAYYLEDGSILAPASSEQGEWKCFFDRSYDDGATWERTADLSISEEMKGKYDSLDKKGIIQPTIWTSDEGYHALMRSTEGKIYRTDSLDAKKWCTPYAIDMPNNNCGIDVVKHPDGRLFLVCNPTDTNPKKTPLSIYVSEDNGKTFELYSNLTTMVGNYLYPAVRFEDGKMHITYTWNYRNVAYVCLSEL